MKVCLCMNTKKDNLFAGTMETFNYKGVKIPVPTDVIEGIYKNAAELNSDPQGFINEILEEIYQKLLKKRQDEEKRERIRTLMKQAVSRSLSAIIEHNPSKSFRDNISPILKNARTRTRRYSPVEEPRRRCKHYDTDDKSCSSKSILSDRYQIIEKNMLKQRDRCREKRSTSREYDREMPRNHWHQGDDELDEQVSLYDANYILRNKGNR